MGIITATASAAAKCISKKLDSELIELEETVTTLWRNCNLNIENESFRLFCKRFDDERVVAKRSIPPHNLSKAGIAYGVYVPMDEEKFPILFQCDSYNWQECCRPYFGNIFIQQYASIKYLVLFSNFYLLSIKEKEQK